MRFRTLLGWFLLRFPECPARGLSSSSMSWSSGEDGCSGGSESSRGHLIDLWLLYMLPWNLDDIKLAIHRFGDGDAFVVHTLIGVHNHWFPSGVNTHTKFVVSCIWVDGNLVHPVLLNYGDLPVDTIVAHLQFQRLAGAVDNLCVRTHCFLYRERWVMHTAGCYKLVTFTQETKERCVRRERLSRTKCLDAALQWFSRSTMSLSILPHELISRKAQYYDQQKKYGSYM